MELKNLTGKHILAGVEIGTTINKFGECCGVVKFTLDGVTYRAVEDPDDGYRSYMQELEIVEEKCKIRVPNVEVLCCMKDNTDYEVNDILVFVDTENGEQFLLVGTGNTDDYYPYCVMEYYPEKLHYNKTTKTKEEGEGK